MEENVAEPLHQGLEHRTSVVRPMLSSSVQVLPSALTLTCRSSSPVSPISARPEKSVWNRADAVSPAASLTILTWCPAPSWPSSPLGGSCWRRGQVPIEDADLHDGIERADRLVVGNVLLGLSRHDIGKAELGRVASLRPAATIVWAPPID